jgi:hypothetical protein
MLSFFHPIKLTDFPAGMHCHRHANGTVAWDFSSRESHLSDSSITAISEMALNSKRFSNAGPNIGLLLYGQTANRMRLL